MKTGATLLFILAAIFAGSAFGATPIVDVRLTGPNNNLQSGSTFTFNSGSSVNFTGSTVTGLSFGTGSVTSVAATVPTSLLAISGSPITTSGTLAITLATQSANLIFAGPSTGSAAAPTFRLMVAADLPATAVTAGTYGDATHVGAFTVDAAGRLTAASSVAITGGGGGSGTVNSGTATQVAYYASTGTAVSSSAQFTVGSSGNPSITAAGTNQNITLTPSGTGVVSSPSSGLFNTTNGDARMLLSYQFSSPSYYPGFWVAGAAAAPDFTNYSFLSSSIGESFFNAWATRFIDFQIGGTTKARLHSSGRLLLGTTTDDGSNQLQVNGGVKAIGAFSSAVASTTANSFTIGSSSAAGDTNYITFQRARGSIASPSAVNSGDRLGFFNFGGYGSGGYFGVASIDVTATQTFTGSSFGSQMDFSTTITGSGSGSVRLRLAGSGNVLIGTTTDDGSNLLQVNGSISVPKTNTAGGTTGAQTINKPAGSVNFAAAATSLVVTDSIVTTGSIIIATVATNDTTLKSIQAVPASGSFTLYANAAATAETKINFLIISP